MIRINFSIAQKTNTLGKSSNIESMLPIAVFLMNKKPFQIKEDNLKNFSSVLEVWNGEFSGGSCIGAEAHSKPTD